MGETETTAKILVVDDNRPLADTYATVLEERYGVETAYSGREALAVVDETVDVVVLDRRMPSMSGSEVLERIRERGLDCRVIVATAVDPDFDIVEMPFDEHLHKPVRRETLVDTVRRQLVVDSRGECASEFVELTSKIRALEQTKPVDELQGDQRFEALREQADELEPRVEAPVPTATQ